MLNGFGLKPGNGSFELLDLCGNSNENDKNFLEENKIPKSLEEVITCVRKNVPEWALKNEAELYGIGIEKYIKKMALKLLNNIEKN